MGRNEEGLYFNLAQELMVKDTKIYREMIGMNCYCFKHIGIIDRFWRDVTWKMAWNAHIYRQMWSRNYYYEREGPVKSLARLSNDIFALILVYFWRNWSNWSISRGFYVKNGLKCPILPPDLVQKVSLWTKRTC